jgi:uncharacterized membrane protein YphA (DoxX/SURF4 family)
MRNWHWTALFFNTDNMVVMWSCFGVWMAVTFAFLIGWQTRLMSVAAWLLTYCFLYRNPNITNGGDDIIVGALFMLMFMPSGQALSVDRWLELRRRRLAGLPLDDICPPLIAPWGVRLLQIQLCAIYFTTGLAKLMGGLEGTWWVGSSVHYVLNDVTMARVSFAQMPQEWWIWAGATWTSVWWEVLFTPLVLLPWTRRWTLWFGVLFHLGIYALIEVGWFSFYTLALYGAWIPGEFWDRVLGSAGPTPGQNGEAAASAIRPS